MSRGVRNQGAGVRGQGAGVGRNAPIMTTPHRLDYAMKKNTERRNRLVQFGSEDEAHSGDGEFVVLGEFVA
jgi:hypothetical protein